VTRSRGVTLALLFSLVGVFFLLLPRWYEEYQHRKWFFETQDLLRQLESRRPNEFTPDEWYDVTTWTMNLHGNCAASPQNITDFDLRNQFLSELDKRLTEKVTGETIEWIWSEYSKFTRNGSSYRSKYMPTQLIEKHRAPQEGRNVRE
jgi:hypothetical protein